MAGSTRNGDHKILLDELVVDTADGVCDIVHGRAIEGVLLAPRQHQPDLPLEYELRPRNEAQC